MTHKELILKTIGWRLVSIVLNAIVILAVVPNSTESTRLILIISLVNIVFYYGYELLWLKIHALETVNKKNI